MQAPDDAALDAYLGQFVRGDVDSIVKSEFGARVLPSTRFVCSDDKGLWILQRVVEKSAVIDRGVYVDTRIEIQNADPDSFGGHMDLLARLDRLADSVVGLQPEDD